MPHFDEQMLKAIIRDEIAKLKLELPEETVELIFRLFHTDAIVHNANKSIALAKGNGRKAMFKRHKKRIRSNTRSYISAIVKEHGHAPQSMEAVVKSITHHSQHPTNRLSEQTRPYHDVPYPITKCSPKRRDDLEMPQR